MSLNIFSHFHKPSDLQVNQAASLADLLTRSQKWIFIDTPYVNFSTLIKREIESPGFSPFSNDGKKKPLFGGKRRAIVIGGGISGLLCAYQLGKFGMTQVSLIEAYGDPRRAENDARAGRMFQSKIRVADGSVQTVELGAMRFPDLSQVFWHYYKLFVHPKTNPDLNPFPNPSRVPTILFAKNSSILKELAYYLPANRNQPCPLPPELQLIADKHLRAFSDYVPPGQGYRMGDIPALLRVDSLTEQSRMIAMNFFASLKNVVGKMSYKDFLIFRGISASELEIIADLGFGTGGFKPLFETSVVDIVRLVIWDYTNEFRVPDQAELPKNMITAINSQAGSNIKFNTAVVGIFFDLLTDEYLVRFANNQWQRCDYLVFAMSHNAALELLDRSEDARLAGIYPELREQHIVPFTDGRASNLLRSDLLNDMRLQANIPSAKIAHIVRGPEDSQARSTYPAIRAMSSQNIIYPIGCVSGDTMSVGNRYILPFNASTLDQSQRCVGIHYAWGESAKHAALVFSDYWASGQINLSAGGPQADQFNLALNTELSYTYNAYRWEKDTRLTGDDRDYFSHFAVNQLGETKGIYWNEVPYIKCGFKLDAPGVGSFMTWNSADRTRYQIVSNGAVNGVYVWDNKQFRAQHPAVARLYFCGDSYSHYGGWVEGALQSALMTSAAVLWRFATDNDRAGDINKAFIDAMFNSAPARA